MATCTNPGRPPDGTPPRYRKCWSHPLRPTDNNNADDRKKSRLFCISKNELETNNNTMPTTSRNVNSTMKSRNSYQDVQEALNSLLWQPYEYQNKSPLSFTVSLSDDLDNNNKASSSSSSLSSSSSSCCSSTSSSVVNNLNRNSFNSGTSRALFGSREPISWPLNLRHSIASPSEYFEKNGIRDSFSCGAASLIGGDVVPISQFNNSAIMQFDVNNGGGGVAAPPPTILNLSSANVVGLPVVHPRNGSEPSMLPQQQQMHHSRSASVPKSMPLQNNNVSNVNVNFYRAVPVNVVAAVPTIQCINSQKSEGNNVSNVQIMPLGQAQQVNQPQVVPVRTFTSTEAQTDDDLGLIREQRRKERRERRKNRSSATSSHHHHHHQQNNRQTVDSSTQVTQTQNVTTTSMQTNERLPDLLNSHMPPPYSPPNLVLSSPPPAVVPPPMLVPTGATVLQSVHSGLVPGFPAPPPQPPPAQAVPLVQTPSGFRFPFPASGFRRGRFSEDPSPKGCCGLLAWKPGSLRWFIAVIALVAVCCVLVGTALGAMRPAGRDHLTVSLLMIGVGTVLVTVSGVAWRLTSHDSSTCRSMLGLGSTESVDVCARRFVPRLPPSYGRPHHPYAAMMYPEFQYRPPPPSYQASMQEYRLRLLLLDRGNTPQMQNSIQNAVSPPPTYRSHVGSLLRAPLTSRRDAAQSEYSCPPSYRSQTSTVLRSTGTLHAASLHHSREHSLSDSNATSEAVVNVVNILAGSDETDMQLIDSLKMEPPSDDGNNNNNSDLNGSSLKMLLKKGSSTADLVDASTNLHKDTSGGNNNNNSNNLVTIVQTSDRNPVIVTVSGSSQIEGSTVQITDIPTEMEILAHL